MEDRHCVKCGRIINGAPKISRDGLLLCRPCGRLDEWEGSDALLSLVDWSRDRLEDA